MRDHHVLHAFLLMMVAVLAIILLPGCEIRTNEQLAKEREIKQQTANLAASIYEAMVAIEQGTPMQGPSVAIKVTANTIIKSNGSTYAPAEQFVLQMTQQANRVAPGTGPYAPRTAP